MEFIVHLIILLAICYFLYKINFYKADTEKTEKKTNSKDEFDAIIDETLYNQEKSMNIDKSDEEVIQVPQSELIHENEATDLRTGLKNAFANEPAQRITYRDCMTQKYKSKVSKSDEAIKRFFAEKQMNVDELAIDILEKKLDYINDVLVPVDNRRHDSFDELTLNLKSKELPLAFTIPPEITKSEEKSQINRFLKHCSIQKVTANRDAVRYNQLKDYAIHNPETHCEHIENASPESNLRYYLIYEHDIKQISKRLGTTIFRTKVYCYCPICRKLVCIIRKEDELGVVNLLEYTPMGKRILKHVEQCVNDSLDNKKRRGYCYDFWNLKESMLLDEFNLIWYPPSVLDPVAKYD